MKGELDQSEISTTFSRILNEDPTLMENLEAMVQQYNAAHPKAPAPKEIVDYLLGEITRIKSVSGQAVPQSPPDREDEKTSIISPDELEDDATAVRADAPSGAPVDPDATVAAAPHHDAASAPLPPPSDATAGSFTGTSTSSDHMMIDLGDEEEDYDVDVGTVISGRYHIVQKLGEGGMGLVFKARDELMAMAEDRNPYVAVKVLTKAFRQRRDAFIALQRETSKAQRLAHPNICTVFHFDKAGETIFMTMELLPGTDMREYINKHIKKPGKGYAMERAWPLIKGIADALSYAHKNNLIHSDLKPGNVFVVTNEKTGQETVKVIDFGIAQAIKPRDANTEAGEVTKFDPKKLGALTPSYATVEMFDGRSPVESDDIYALGCIAYELLACKRPYDRLTAKKAQLQGVKRPTVSLKNLGLTSRQERGLIKSVRLYRQDRTKSIEEFISEVAPRKSYVWQIAAGVVGFLALVGVLAYPNVEAYFQAQANAELESRLESPEAAVFVNALDDLLAYDLDGKIEERLKVANRNRDLIQDRISDLCVDLFKPEEKRYDLPAATALMVKGFRLFPDSSTLKSLQATMRFELNQENSELGNLLADALKTRTLLATEDSIGAIGILERAQTLSPDNTLLRDPILRFVFRDEAQTSIDKREFEKADTIIKSSRSYIADAKTMPLYMGDELTLERTKQLRADLRKQIEALVAKSLGADLRAQRQAEMGTQISLLRSLDPGNTTLARVVGRNDGLFSGMLAQASPAQSQSVFDEFGGLVSMGALYHGRLKALASGPLALTPEESAHRQTTQTQLAVAAASLSEVMLDPEKLSAFGQQSRQLVSLGFSVEGLREAMGAYVKSLAASLDKSVQDNRYRLARLQLWQTRALVPPESRGVLAGYEERIDRELLAFNDSERRARAQARIDSIRQNLDRQLEARNIAQARKVEKELRNVMDPQDPYLAEELPRKYAEALNELSINSIEQGNIRQARNYFRDLSKLIKKTDKRYIRLDNLLKGETIKERLLSQVKRANVLYEQDIRKKVGQLTRLNAWAIDEFQEKLVSAVIKRAEQLVLRSEDRALLMIETARGLFPDSPQLQGYRLGDTSDDDSIEDAGLSEETTKALQDAGGSGGDPKLNQLVASMQENMQKRQLTATFRILEQARKQFPGDDRISALDKAYRKERTKAEDAYKKHNSAVLRGDFNNATKFIRAAIGYWRDNDEYKKASKNVSRIQQQVKAGARVCSDNLSGKGKNPRAFCHDIFDGKRGPRLVIIPGNEGLLSSFVMTRHEITIGEFNLYCKSSRKCKPVRGKSKLPVTNVPAKQMKGYAAWLSSKSLYTYRLPTLQEWMYATTANNKEENDDYNCTLRISGQQVKGHEVQEAAKGKPNRWGLINYVGNVDEVVVDGNKFVLKGGNHKDPMFSCKTATTKQDYNGSAQALVGFRLVRTLH